MELVKKLLPYIILVGIASFVLCMVFEENNTLLTEQYINGVKIYTFDLSKHLQNLQENADTQPMIQTSILPTRQWIATWTDAGSWWNALVNNLAFTFDWLYMPFNAILYVWRWTIWVGRLLLAFLGLPKNSWLMQELTYTIKTMLIPYI